MLPRVWNNWNFHILLVLVQNGAIKKSSGNFINVNTYLSYNPTISTLCIYERDKKTYVHKKTWIDVHVRNLD